jgi:hypothetical protein
MEMVMQATATGGRRMMVPASTGRVTMSGLLNLMDGVGSDDGRIIFATVSLGHHLPTFSVLTYWTIRRTTTTDWIQPSFVLVA